MGIGWSFSAFIGILCSLMSEYGAKILKVEPGYATLSVVVVRDLFGHLDALPVCFKLLAQVR